MNKKLYRDGPYEDFFSQGVLVGNILTLAGQIGVDEEGNSPEDIKWQMVICYKNKYLGYFFYFFQRFFY